MGAFGQVTGVVSELAGGCGVGDPLGLDLHHGGNVTSPDQDVCATVAGLGGLDDDPGYLAEYPDSLRFQGACDIYNLVVLHNDCKSSQFCKYWQGPGFQGYQRSTLGEVLRSGLLGRTMA